MKNKTLPYILTTLTTLTLITTTLLLAPIYNVWRQTKQGEAELRRAEYNRQITVREANATLESATLLAQAEIERAKGVAEANTIIGTSLQDNDMYIRYLWVQGVHNNTNTVIYIPTEANLPILEARTPQTTTTP